MLDDVTINVLQAAMHGLSARQSAISQDIANVNTPYYRARSVAFEDSLKAAIQDGDNPLSVQPTVSYSTADGGTNGNNVDLAAETTSSVETEMSYELALRATSDRFNLINTAIKGS